MPTGRGITKLWSNSLSLKWRKHFQPTLASASRSILNAENGLIALFLVLGFIGILNHEIWRDEAQAWLIARDSTSLIDLYANTRYEGHPILWHTCLFLIAKWTHNPFAMQVFHLGIATGSAALIIKKSPFSLLQRGLLSFSYLLFYEYSIISRNYTIGVFLFLLFCVLYARRRPIYWLLSLVLVLAANANAFAFLISFSLASVMLLRLLSESKSSPVSAIWRRLTPSLAILTAGWGFSLMQLVRSRELPDVEGGSGTGHGPASDLAMTQLDQAIALFNRAAGLCDPFSRVYFPLMRTRLHFWTTHLLSDPKGLGTVNGLEIGALLAVILTIVIVVCVLKALWKTPLYLWLYVSASVSLYSFFVLIYKGTTRHNGHLMIVLIVSLWLASWSQNRQEPRQNQRPRALARVKRPVVGGTLLTILLIFQCVSSVQAYAIDLVYPFSSSRAIAQYIRAHELEDLPIFAQNGRLMTGLISYLDTDAYYGQIGIYGSFATKLYKKEKETDEIIIAEVKDFSRQQPEFLIASENPIDFSAIESNVVLLTKLEETIVKSERLYLYKFDNAPR